MKKLLFVILLFVPRVAIAQPALPCTANQGQWIITTSSAALWVCNSNSTAWINATAGTPSVPTGLITLVFSGSCPVGFDEVSELNGKTLVGTLAANANVGTTGGADNITPAGTNSSLIFTGTALATHSHELPFIKLAGATGALRMLDPTIFGTGTSRAPISTSANPTANTTAAAVLKDQPLSAGTPAGTINTPVFTGIQFDNRSAFIRVIFCRKS